MEQNSHGEKFAGVKEHENPHGTSLFKRCPTVEHGKVGKRNWTRFLPKEQQIESAKKKKKKKGHFWTE